MAQPFRATLDGIVAAVPISALQSATIVCEVTEKLERWVRIKRPTDVVVPTVEDISITQGGSVWWCRGRAVPAARVIPALGSLLDSLLNDAVMRRTPAGLLYVVARATDPRHLAPFADLDEFHTTLARYAALRRSLAIDALLAQFSIACSGLPPLTSESSISDVRRLRRAGGVALPQIAQDTGIPISLLRELEWGVYTNWNIEHARGALALYAERAGLDTDAVAQVVGREQVTGLMGQPEVTVEAGQHDSGDYSAFPFALATVLIGALIVLTMAAPGDRAPSPTPTRTIVRDAPAPARTPLAIPADHPATLEPHRQVTPAANPLPHRVRQASATPRRRVPPPRDERHPLLRLARAIVGDGRYRVEPFPKIERRTMNDER